MITKQTAVALLLAVLAAPWGTALATDTGGGPKLYYSRPAEKWTEALPVGNGRLGAMVFGGITSERVQFNEDTIWKGQPHDYVRAGAKERLPEIRKLLAEGKTKDAEKMAKESFLSDPVRQKAYQPFGDLRFEFAGQEAATNYVRELDLDAAVVRVSYSANGINYRRETFASYPDQSIVMRLTADKPGQINFRLKMDSPHTNSATKAIGPDTLTLTGQVQEGGVRFGGQVCVLNTGGSVTKDGNSLVVANANEVTIILTGASSYKDFQDISGNPAERSAQDLARAKTRGYQKLLESHLADHRNLFRRVSIDLGKTDRDKLPTDERLMQVKTSGLEADPGLAALEFQYGRYVMIASSRPGGQPANLQGLWNESLDPPWESKWTVNINCEMNYWPVEVANLSECHMPLFDMIDDLVVSGGRTAEEQYGCSGWVLHHNTDIWRGTAPINGVDGVWPTGGAWLCQHLWEHYLFTGDKDFLARRAYPVFKKATEFFLDFLITDPKTGWLVTSPSFSPEQGSLTIGPTMDEQLIRALMNYTVSSAVILGMDKDFAAKVAAARAKLAPNQIGKHGQLQEWLEDIDKPNNNHRHMSPLVALYPGAEITPSDEKIFAAAKVLLGWRGDGSTGWSYAWRIPLWGRVGDGDFAFRQLSGLLQKRTLPNLFDLCGPFQIDGNFGATAGMSELLLQSHLTESPTPKAFGVQSNPESIRGAVENVESGTRIIDLLPALPKAWPNGEIKGLRGRGGFEVDMAWSNGTLTRAAIRSKLGQPVRLRYHERSVELKTKAGKEYTFNGELKPVK